MPRFFFHFRDGELTEDDIGQELPNIDAAREEARCLARELAGVGEPATASIRVTDGQQVLFEIDLRPYQ